MKGKQYVTAGTCIVSTIFGMLATLVAWAILHDSLLALTIGVGTTCAFAVVLPLRFFFEDRRYLDIEDVITEEVLLKEQINFSYPANGRSGYLCVTRSAIYLFSRDKRPYIAYRLPKDSTLSAELRSAICLKLLVRNHENGDDAIFTVMSPNGELIYKTLRESGWPAAE
jgi:hypothetical protein